MIAVLLTAHVLIVLALIGVVLLQRSEGGALGIGGGGGGGGFMTGRGAANALTRTTSVLAALFFSTSMTLAVFADRGESDDAVLQELTGAPQDAANVTDAPTTADDLLRTLGAGAEDDEASGVESLESAVGEAAPAAEKPAAAPDGADEAPPAETEDDAPPEDATPPESSN